MRRSVPADSLDRRSGRAERIEKRLNLIDGTV